MVYRQSLQTSRYELKYIINEERAAGIRDFVRPYLVTDAYADPNNGNAYPVHSLYMDSAGLVLFRQTLQGLKNRFKLRIRFYDGNPDSPVFLEIKSRTTDVIRKQRAALTREGVREFLDGFRPSPSHLITGNGSAKALSALNEFVNLRDAIRAIPAVYVSYTREAYVSPESNRIRVTFDRELSGAAFDPETAFHLPTSSARPKIGGVILELKFTDRFPNWMHEMVGAFCLHRTSMPKYIECIRSMGVVAVRRDGLVEQGIIP
jgi:SPX domain protein involved in polyphosphate accumulation